MSTFFCILFLVVSRTQCTNLLKQVTHLQGSQLSKIEKSPRLSLLFSVNRAFNTTDLTIFVRVAAVSADEEAVMRGRDMETQSRLVRERGLTDDTGQVAQLLLRVAGRRAGRVYFRCAGLQKHVYVYLCFTVTLLEQPPLLGKLPCFTNSIGQPPVRNVDNNDCPYKSHL